MTHTFTLRWRFGIVNRFINRFLKKFERAEDKCLNGMVDADAKIAELRIIKAEFSKNADIVGGFLSSLKR